MRSRRPTRLQPLALATLLALSASGLNAAPRVFAGPGSFWDVVANWTGGLLPGIDDDVLLGAFDTHVRSNFSINSFSGTGTLTLSAGTLSFAAASSTGGYVQTGGVLAGAGNLTVNGAATLGGGGMTGSGQTVFNGAVSFNNFVSFGVDEGRTLQFNAGVTLNNNSLNLNPGNSGNAAAGRLVNAAGSILLDVGSSGSNIFTQNFGGADNGASASFSNAGTYHKTGSGNSGINVNFLNSGSVIVDAGTLHLGGGGTHSGASFSGAGTLNFSGGVHELNSGSSVTVVNLGNSGGTVNMAGTLNVGGGTTVNGGTLNLANATLLSLGQSLNLSGGLLDLGAQNLTVATMTQSGGTVNGSGRLTVSGAASITGGGAIGTGETLFNGAVVFGNFAGYGLDAGRALHFTAGATLNNNSLNLNPGNTGNAAAGRLINAAGSTVLDTGSSGSSIFTQNFGGADNGASASFSNAGTYHKTGSGNTNIGVNFINSGSVIVDAGTLNLGGGGTHSGASFSGAGTLTFSGGVHDIDAASVLSVSTLGANGGTVNLLGSYAVGATTVMGGTLNLQSTTVTSLGQTLTLGSGTLNLGSNNASVGTLAHSGGALIGSGRLTVLGAATFSGGVGAGGGETVLNGAASFGNFASYGLDEGRTLQFIAGATLSNNGINLNPGNSGNAAAGRLVNAAGSTVLDIGNSGSNIFTQNFGGADNGASASFSNAGAYHKTGSGSTNVGVNFINSGSIVVDAGTLQLSGGGTHSGASFSGAGTLSFAGGVHDIDAASTITASRVNQTGGTTHMTGTYQVGDTTTVTGGTLDLSGASIVSLGQQLVVGGGSLNLGGHPSTVATLNQTGGTLIGSGRLTVSGAATIGGGGAIGSGETLLAGTATFNNFASYGLDEGRVLRFTAGGTLSNNSFNLNPGNSGNAAAGRIVNEAGSTLVDVGNSGSNIFTQNFGGVDNGASASFTNAGSYNKTGTGTTTISTPFTHSGSMEVNAGVMNLSGGGSHSGSFSVGAGATLAFSGGVHALDNAAAMNNQGTLLFNGSTSTLAGNLDSAALLSLTSGNLQLGSGNHRSSRYNQSSGTLAGSGTLTVTGLATLSGGAMLGPGETVLAGGASFSASASLSLDEGRTLRFTAGGTLNNNSFNLNPGNSGNAAAGRIVNAAGSTLSDSGSTGIHIFTQNFGGVDNGASARVANEGSFVKTSGGASNISAPFFNSGSVNVNAGTLNLSGGGTHGGSFGIAADATLAFTGGAHALDNAAGISNAGTLLFSGGSSTLAGNLDSAALLSLTGGSLGTTTGQHRSASFRQSGGDLLGSGTLTVTGAATLQGGRMLGTGQTVLQGDTTFTPSASLSLDDGRQLVIAGTASLVSTSLNLNPANTGNASAGRLVVRAGATATDSGTGGVNVFTQNFGGSDNGSTAALVLQGSYLKTSTGTTSFSVAVQNDGLLDLSAGVLNLNTGLSGSGTLATHDTARVNLAVNGSIGTLLHGSGQTQGLSLGTNTLTVFTDYDNASFGVGNSFNRRANVATTGTGARLIAAGDVNQALAGAAISGGQGSTPVLNFGNVHVGSTTLVYEIVNVGSSGPALRGAVQTAANGASLSDARLSGDGVAAANWGPVAAGSSLARSVTLTVADAGVYAPLAGQSVNVLNNFDNTRSQLLTIGSTAGAAAYHLAAAAAVAPNPVQLPNQRVGMALLGALTVSNSAPTGSFTEGLNASFGSLTGEALNNGGSLTLLAAGSSNGSSMALGVDTSSAGAKSGTAQLLFSSDGSGSSGLGVTVLAAQTVGVSGNVYRLAQASNVTPSNVSLGNVRLGGLVTQSLLLANVAAADGFSESLNASISGSAGLSTGGSFVGLAAGASSNSLFVGFDTSVAGARSGTATITLASNGTGTSGLADFGLGTQLVTVSASVYRLASASAATPNPVQLADQRVGGNLRQALTLSNTALADGFSEGLNASISASGNAVASGSFSLLAAGASSQALQVGVDTSSAGARSGTATLTLSSDGGGSSGFGALALGTQTVAVSGNVYRLAVPVVDTTPVTLVGRVGDATLASSIAVQNNAPDLFTERLNASIGGTPAGVVGGPALVGLAPGASGSLGLTLGTGTAGSFSGPVAVSLVSSSAGTSSGAPDFNLGSVNVNLDARVYAPAVATLPVTVVNFGTVRVGDTVAPRSLTVSNTASGALTDTLQASISGGGTPFSSSGSVTGLVAGASNSSSLQVQLATATAGAFSATATVQLLSQNPELADLALAAVNVQLQGQVNQLAQAVLAQAGGSGSFSGAASSYTLDFGTVVVDTGTLTGSLSLGNATLGTADALAGSWNLTTLAGGPFSVAGFEAFTGLAAGSQLAGLTVSFAVNTEGSFSRTVVLNALSTNGSGPDLALGPITLELQGTVVAVPEPGTYLMMAVGVLMMGCIARRKLRAQPR